MRRRQRQLLLLLEEEEDEEELYELLLYKTHRACCLDAISKGQSVRRLNHQFFKAQKVRRLNRGLMYTSETTLFKLKTERLNLFQRAEDEQNESVRGIIKNRCNELTEDIKETEKKLDETKQILLKLKR